MNFAMQRLESNPAHRIARSSDLLICVLMGLLLSLCSAVAGEAPGTAVRDFTDFKLITDRNIFDPNRRAPRVGGTPPRPPVVDSFTFSGTMGYSKGWFAFFDGTSADLSKVAEEGDTIGGHKITEIGHDLVCLTLHETNEVKLTVGMQMRRSSDGSWRPAAASSVAGSSVAANTRWNGGGRMDRGRDRDDNERGGRMRGREDMRAGNWGNAWNQGNAASVFQSMQPPAAAMPSLGNTEGLSTAEIMRLRRMQETGEAQVQPGEGPVQGERLQRNDSEGESRETEQVNDTEPAGEPAQPEAAPVPIQRFRMETGPIDGNPGGENTVNGNDNNNLSNED
jgi:hypothetical protein